MGYLEILHRPQLRHPTMLMAFAGWADAAEGATGALTYLVRSLRAQKFASIDPEEFYDFTHVRPITHVAEDGLREVRWPANELYGWRDPQEERDLVVLVGIEPNLKWRTFARVIVDLAVETGVTSVVTLGALLDTVPHTRPIRLTGASPDPGMRQRLEGLAVRGGSYQGPTGVTTAIIQAFREKGIPYGSVWGHAPHYVRVTHYPKVSLALLTALQKVLGMTLDLEGLRAEEARFDREFQEVLARESEIQAYVRRLERRYDESDEPQTPIPSPEEMVKELEEFLKRGHREGGSPEEPRA